MNSGEAESIVQPECADSQRNIGFKHPNCGACLRFSLHLMSQSTHLRLQMLKKDKDLVGKTLGLHQSLLVPPGFAGKGVTTG